MSQPRGRDGQGFRTQEKQAERGLSGISEAMPGTENSMNGERSEGL